MEVYFHANSARQTAAFRGIARRLGLAESGGSDFHGDSKPEVKLGSGFGNLRIPYRLLEDLKEARTT
jgi:hypothetical protein